MANYTIAAIKSAQVVAKLKKELYDWDEIEQRYTEVLDLASQALDNIEELNDEERRIAFAAADEAVYNIAFARYVDGDYPGAIKLLTSAEPNLLKSKVLLGTLFHRLASDMQGVEFFEKAAPLLRVLEQQEEQVWQEDIDSMDDMMLGGGYLYLSMLYRFGFGVSKDLQHAYEVLQKGARRVKDEGRQELLKQEMAHYHKTLFGSWEYR